MKKIIVIIICIIVSLMLISNIAAVAPIAETIPHQHIWVSGVCNQCGIICNHNFIDGICSKCQLECQHPSHDEQTRICTLCGLPCAHDYKNNQCSRCGRELVLYEDYLPDEYYLPCEHEGTIEYVQVQTNRGPQTIGIYTPYGYDPTQKYDVMVLIGGLNATCKIWFDQYLPIWTKNINIKPLLDNMIDKGNCRPVIFMSINTYSLTAMPIYMKDYFLPYLIENYSTYAESVEDMPNQREHFGLGGFSWGGYQTYYGGFRELFDLFGKYCPIAGSTEPELAADALNNQFSAYDVNLFICGCGTQDALYKLTYSHYDYMINNVHIFKEGKNTYWFECEAPHSWKEATIIMCDFLQIAFP